MKPVLKTLTAAAALLSTTSGAFAFEDGKLIIWMGGGKGTANLQAIGDQFAADLGVEVSVQEVDPLTEKFQQAAATGDGPDIVIWAHDRFGEWAAAGLIQPVEPSAEFQSGILASGWDAVSSGGKIWGYPVSIEAVGLIYNTDIIDTPPADFADIAGLDMPEGVAPIMWDYNNTYFTMPMLMAGGGFAFKKVDGVFDGTKTGVNNEGSIAGASVLKELIDSGTMPSGVDYGVMDGAMNKGEVAMVINGPWAWSNFTASGINFAVAPIPAVNGKASPPFLGVYSAAVNAASPNKDLAVELLENYALTDDGLATWNAGSDLGALADISAASAQDNANVAATLANAATGIPMPSNPEMGAFWSAMEPALGNITSGASSVEDALNDAAARILGE